MCGGVCGWVGCVCGGGGVHLVVEMRVGACLHCYIKQSAMTIIAMQHDLSLVCGCWVCGSWCLCILSVKAMCHAHNQKIVCTYFRVWGGVCVCVWGVGVGVWVGVCMCVGVCVWGGGCLSMLSYKTKCHMHNQYNMPF